MAVVRTLSNYWKYAQGKKLVDVSSDTFKIILMNDTFAFDKDAHATLADIVADELATDHGYTQDTKELSGGAWAQDDTGDQGIRTFDTPNWTASGGDIGPTGSAIIYDDSATVGSPLSPIIVGCIDFGEDFTVPDGSMFQILTPAIANT